MAINPTQPKGKEGDSVGMEAGAAEAQRRLETIGASQSFDLASRLCEIDFSDTKGIGSRPRAPILQRDGRAGLRGMYTSGPETHEANKLVKESTGLWKEEEARITDRSCLGKDLYDRRLQRLP